MAGALGAFQATAADWSELHPLLPLLTSCAYSGAAGQGSLEEGADPTVGVLQAELGVRGPGSSQDCPFQPAPLQKLLTLSELQGNSL